MADFFDSDDEWDDSNTNKRKRSSQLGQATDTELASSSKRMKTAETDDADETVYVVLDNSDIAELANTLGEQSFGLAVGKKGKKDPPAPPTTEQLQQQLTSITKDMTDVLGPRIHNFWMDIANFDTLRRRITDFQRHTNNPLYRLIFEPGIENFRAIRVDLANRMEQFRTNVNRVKVDLRSLSQSSAIFVKGRELVEEAEECLENWGPKLHWPFSLPAVGYYHPYNKAMATLREAVVQVSKHDLREAVSAMSSISKLMFRADIKELVFVMEVRARQLALKAISLQKSLESARLGFDFANEYVEIHALNELPPPVYQGICHAIGIVISTYIEGFDEMMQTLLDSFPESTFAPDAAGRILAAETILKPAKAAMSAEEIAAIDATGYPNSRELSSLWAHDLDRARAVFDPLLLQLRMLKRGIELDVEGLGDGEKLPVPQFEPHFQEYKVFKIVFVTFRDALPQLPNHPVNHSITPEAIKHLASLIQEIHALLCKYIGSNQGRMVPPFYTDRRVLWEEVLKDPYVATYFKYEPTIYTRDDDVMSGEDDGEDSHSDEEYAKGEDFQYFYHQ